MSNAGSSLMGQGRAAGKDRAREAALLATSSPLLEVRARGLGRRAAMTLRPGEPSVPYATP
jgi:cell division GTPase FtsZ